MKPFRPTAMALAASFILAASCATSSRPASPAAEPAPPPAPSAEPAPAPPQPPPSAQPPVEQAPAPQAPAAPSEADILATGALLFSEGRIGEAAEAWSSLPEAGQRSLFVGFAEAYSSFDVAVTGVEAAMAATGPEAAIAAASEVGQAPSPPRPLPELAADPLGAVARLDRVLAEAAGALVARAAETEREADADLEQARSGRDKDAASIAGAASGGFSEAGRLYRSASDQVPEAEASAKRTEAKALAAAELRERLLKESLLAFPERMGAVFARSNPSPSRLSDKELLAFNAETAAMISSALSDFDKIVAEHPGIIDPTTLEKLRDSARGLSARFAKAESAMRKVKDRGKPLIPLVIGIFNPQPGDPLRSRPASFAGRLSSGSDWWWGIADIPSGLAQDLVITMSDSRPVRVYAAGIGSGSKSGASDLVNPIFRVGNSWPVLNAGARLDNGVFHIEVGPSRSEGYRGEAAVYKSFMTRTR